MIQDARLTEIATSGPLDQDTPLTLVSYDLCPYVQRAAIVLAEKGIGFRRVDIDLADKPEWFKAMSPLGKVPLLQVGEDVLFESAAIVEYLEDTRGPALHPADALTRARDRAWMEFGSTILSDIWTVETTPDPALFDAKVLVLKGKFARVEAELVEGPYFHGSAFCVVDAVFAPIFRYFDVFDDMRDLGVFAGTPKVRAWRAALAGRASVKHAVGEDYADRLRVFLRRHDGHIAKLMN